MAAIFPSAAQVLRVADGGPATWGPDPGTSMGPGTAIAFVPAAATGKQTIYVYAKDLGLNVDMELVMRARNATFGQDVSGTVISSRDLEATFDATGYATLQVVKGAVVTVEIVSGAIPFFTKTFTVTSDTTKALTDY